MNKLWMEKRNIAVLIAPGLLFIIGMVLLPTAVALYLSFTNYDGVDYNLFNLSNYKEIFLHDSIFWDALRNSILLGIAFVVLQHPIAVLMAILTTHAGKWERPLRILIFIPSIISTFVTSQMWVSLLNVQFGLLNRMLTAVGLSSWKQDWLGNPDIAIYSIIFVAMWQGFGYAYLLYYAGIKGIPSELYEAAIVDGANKWRYGRSIILPLLMPVIRINFVLAIVAGFKQMETVFLMTGGGPSNSTQFLGTYLYSRAFRDGLFGYGNAISILFIVFCLVVTLIMNRLLKKDVGEF
ncbi:carbohydrate ABC transporter permease [Cohnella lupini]|uniref:Carbohydrate ABC transporter membrane protein 1 (CUT1 family) n=1 Tax=Cohnella lupini TaxID=1294267 RepID=A0A3D9IYM2_9BACL|nr:sugar ABC transporter permease [Cohnella lupini]RED66176.1 carbohydrate ABC transporter membrane protein 1 (CUT1 family) [Cohnella lupini]